MRREKTERLKKDRVAFLNRFYDEVEKIEEDLLYPEDDFKELMVDMWNCEDQEIWDLYHKILNEIDKARDIMTDIEDEITGLENKKERELGARKIKLGGGCP